MEEKEINISEKTISVGVTIGVIGILLIYGIDWSTSAIKIYEFMHSEALALIIFAIAILVAFGILFIGILQYGFYKGMYMSLLPAIFWSVIIGIILMVVSTFINSSLGEWLKSTGQYIEYTW